MTAEIRDPLLLLILILLLIPAAQLCLAKKIRSRTGYLTPGILRSAGWLQQFPKIFRTAARLRCQIKQVKAIRAAARFLYLLFLRVRCPNPFFGFLVRPVANDSVDFS